MVSTSVKSLLAATATTILLGSLAPIVAAQGSIWACNYSGQTVYYEIVGAGGDYGNNELVDQSCQNLEYGQQISMKMDYDGTFDAPYQFEFNFDVDQWAVYYDFSAINGNPFGNVARAIFPSDTTCQQIYCDAGDYSNDCQYTDPYDFGAPGCGADTSLTMNIG